MDPQDDDEGPELCLAASAAAPRISAPTDDYARHLRAEARWQGWLAARRLWDRVTRCIALGR